MTVRRALLLAALALLPRPALAGTIRADDDRTLRQALERAGPGDVVLVAPGEYRGGLSATGLRGAEGSPVVIAGADAKRPPVIRGGGTGLHLVAPAHVEVRDLVVEGATGNGINVDDGGDRARPAGHVVLLRLTVRNIGPRGNCDGIKLSGVEDFRVEACTLERWGDGGSGVDMVGCHRGVVADCSFRHEGGAGGSGVQAKGGSRDVRIRGCRFEHAGGRAVNLGGSTGREWFRPPDPGYEAKDLCVEDCVFVGSLAPVAFTGVDGAVFRNNLLYRPGRWVARILQESRGPEFAPCRDGLFERNLVVYRSADVAVPVNVGPGTEPGTFVFRENWWFCEDRPGAGRPALPVEEEGGVHGRDPRLRDPEGGDFRPGPGSPAARYGPRSR